MIRRRVRAVRTRIAPPPCLRRHFLFFAWLAAALLAPGPAAAQVLPEDDPAIPDSLRFESPEERAVADSIPQNWEVDESGEGFDLVFEDIPEDDLEVAEDYAGATKIWPYVHYNRVDAWALGLDFSFEPRTGWVPEFDVRFAHVFNRDHIWLYAVGLRQPILSERRLLIGVEARRFTDHFDDRRVPDGENFASTFFFKFDYRDYFERRGVSVFVDAHAGAGTTARLVYDRHTYTSITDIAPGTWSVFRNSEEWRENPAVDEGVIASVGIEAEWDTRADDKTPGDGVQARARVEMASDDLDSDYTYALYLLDGSAHWSPRENMFLKGRLGLGTSGTGALPFQKEFAIGGIGTLRAHPFKSSRGNQVLFSTLEYQLRVVRGRERAGVRTDLRAVVFADFGQAWRSSRFDLSGQAVLMDAGLGLAMADERVALYVAQDLRNPKLDPVASIRVSQPF